MEELDSYETVEANEDIKQEIPQKKQVVVKQTKEDFIKQKQDREIKEVLEFMISFYKDNQRLPSISETVNATGKGFTKVKKIRAGMRKTKDNEFGYFVSNYDNTISPTSLFISLVENYSNESTKDKEVENERERI